MKKALLAVLLIMVLFGCSSTKEIYLHVDEDIPKWIGKIEVRSIDTLSDEAKVLRYRLK
jgi:hypothetical protein